MNPTFKIPYTDWSFLFPPRPEKAITPSLLPSYEKMGFLAQYKMNGTCSLIGVSPTGTVHTLTRHNTPHKRWAITGKTKDIAAYGKPGYWTVFLAELLNDKTTDIKDTLYIFDILVNESVQLVGTTFEDRSKFLASILPHEDTGEASHFVVTPNILLAKSITSNLSEAFGNILSAGNKAHEGLVIKNPTVPLDLLFRTSNNQGWQLKTRVPNNHGHISF